MWWEALLWSLLAGVVGTLIGALIPVTVHGRGEKILSALMAFTAGFMAALVFLDVMPESLESTGRIWVTLIVTLVGAGIVFLAGVLLDKKAGEHKHTDAEELPDLHSSEGKRELYVGFSLVTALVLHNIPEGMMIGSLSASGSAWLAALLIALHNIPEGIAMCAAFCKAGVKRWLSVLIAVSTGLAAVAGALIGFFVSNISGMLTGICLALSAGAMLYIIFDDMLAEAYARTKCKKVAALAILGIIAGALILWLAE